MHSAAASCACASSVSAHASSSSSESPSVNQSCPRHTSSIPVSKRNGADCDADIFVNANAPQCCHCGWRGSHSPSCPFR
ncbi:hypothetical protein PAXRUDRAFT_135711 [Paxillus rubicundulus Ve08.2h10]|uniref:Uncharacterized protein n=1 Tax=Paxillus rubicundulus Ve08.2h10 TaxID=930991 RepID=A0A0D0DHI9_9AGAM|nr:hypothetical protein PAXRUDRAFT_135711 [Paxillus rubicundulus Ve08.2h10]